MMKRISTIFLSFVLLSSVYGQIGDGIKTFKDDFSGIEITHLSSQIQKTSQAAKNNQYENPLFQDLREYTLDSVVMEGYSPDGSHSPAVKIEYKYNSDGKSTTILDYHWDAGAWQVNSKTEYTYFDGNNHMLVSDYDWYDSIWNIFTKSDYYFDNQNNETLCIDSIYSYLHNRWMIAQKIEKEYDANGNNVLYHSISYQNDQVKSQLEYQYSYDDLSRLILAIVSQAYLNPNELKPTFKLEYSYDLNDNQTNIMISSWQADSSDWVPIRKEDYIYNSSGHVISEITSNYLSYSDDWEYQGKYDYTYDANNNPDVGLSYYWDNYYNQWGIESKKEHSYDGTKTITDVNVPSMDVYEQDYPEYIVNAPVHYIYSEVGIGDLETVYASTYFYSETNLDVFEVTDAEISTYPNPATTQVSFVSPEHQANTGHQALLRIFDLSGKQMAQIQVRDGKAVWNCTSVKPGLYVYSTVLNRQKITGKIVVTN